MQIQHKANAIYIRTFSQRKHTKKNIFLRMFAQK